MNSRRDFLQKVSLGIGVTALAGLPATAAAPSVPWFVLKSSSVLPLWVWAVTPIS